MKKSTISRFAARVCLGLAILDLITFMGMKPEDKGFWTMAFFTALNAGLFWLNETFADREEAKEKAAEKSSEPKDNQ
jgi:hypothetical protein